MQEYMYKHVLLIFCYNFEFTFDGVILLLPYLKMFCCRSRNNCCNLAYVLLLKYADFMRSRIFLLACKLKIAAMFAFVFNCRTWELVV